MTSSDERHLQSETGITQNILPYTAQKVFCQRIKIVTLLIKLLIIIKVFM